MENLEKEISGKHTEVSENNDATNEVKTDEVLTEASKAQEEKPEEEKKTVVEFKEDKTEVEEKKPRKHKPFFVLKICLLIIAVLLLIAAIIGSWIRWFSFDDKADIVGTWQIPNSLQTMVVSDTLMDLGKNAVLEYTVDAGAKVINYKIGDMSGTTHYRFSADRNQLALVENCNTDPISTMLSDLGWFWDYMTCKMAKIDLSPAYTKNNKEEVDTKNTGLDDIMFKGNTMSILLDRVATKDTTSE